MKSNLILEFNNASELFSRDSFEMISIQAHAFLTYQRDKKKQWMGARYEAHPWSTKCYYHHKTSATLETSEETWRPFGGLERLSHSARV